jgi:hypothetical protein
MIKSFHLKIKSEMVIEIKTHSIKIRQKKIGFLKIHTNLIKI